MGYDFSIRFKNIEETNKMLEFLNAHKNIVERLKYTDNTGFNFTFYTGSEIGSSAPHELCETLINMHDSGIPSYVYRLGAWMAVQSSYRNEAGMAILYHDHEIINLYTDNAPIAELLVDKNGFILGRGQKNNNVHTFVKRSLRLGPDVEKQKQIIAELHQLWTIWLTTYI